MVSGWAVMLKIAVAVSVEPMAMQFKATLKKTTNQTAFTGVWVRELTFDKKPEKGRALSLANA